MVEPVRVLLCRVGSERFALPLAAVREVVAAPPAARLPGAPDAVRGVANVHGTLVTVFSAARLLGFPEGSAGEWLIVLSLTGGRVGLEVDEVEDLDQAGAAGARRLDPEDLIGPLLVRAE